MAPILGYVAPTHLRYALGYAFIDARRRANQTGD
ncbi:hypothetical protein C7477_10617 [Phyllobacterium leguminum]|uniref:Uncharacterized protein n=1 Tax=Phyllobacterium leguminum TaxID=314237 RepID=A0A318T2C0_9HYPH|nr:hypothetical protein C7477_10617 [Phyllobacterium leguminum]